MKFLAQNVGNHLIDKIRKMVESYENYEDTIGWTRDEDFNYQMAQALLAVDDVLKPYVKSILLSREEDNSYEAGYAAALGDVRKAMEPTKGVMDYVNR